MSLNRDISTVKKVPADVALLTARAYSGGKQALLLVSTPLRAPKHSLVTEAGVVPDADLAIN